MAAATFPTVPWALAVSLCGLVAFVCSCNSDNGGDCHAAGGQCVIGNVICAVPGPQSCGPITPAGLFCCLSQTADCGQPAALTYACPAASDAGASCKGTPPPPIGAPNFAALEDAGDPDASIAVGCVATFPVCGSGMPFECTCSAQGDSGIWSCVY